MISNIYRTEENTIVTRASSGRDMFNYRQPVKSADLYEYTLTFGENYHSLAAIVFGDDAFWWVLSDMNKPRDGFRLVANDKILLPETIVREDAGLKKFF